jgi:hypothetical protein
MGAGEFGVQPVAEAQELGEGRFGVLPLSFSVPVKWPLLATMSQYLAKRRMRCICSKGISRVERIS